MALCAVVSLFSLAAPRAYAGRDRTPPTTPSNLHTTSISSYAVSLEWNPAFEASGTLSYRVAISDGREMSLAKASTSVRLSSGLTPGKSYAFCVYAVDGSGNRSRSSCTSASLPADTLAPSAPVLAAPYAGLDRVWLSWSPSSDDGSRVSYEVWMDGAYLLNAGAATSISVGDLEPGTSYTFAVRAVDPYGNASMSAAASVTTLDDVGDDVTPPTAPSGLTGFDDCCDEVFLSWNPSVDDRDPRASLSYEIYVDGGLYDVLVGADSLTVVVDGPGLHTFEVIAVDAAGNASSSAVTTVASTVCN